MSLLISMTSGKGGTGKSTVAGGLAVAFSRLGKSVLIIDMDAGLRCLDAFFGVDSNVVFDLSDILGGHEIADAIYDVPSYSGISLIPAPMKPTKINPEDFRQLIDTVKTQFDVIILDFPAGTDFSLYGIIGENTQFLAVCNPDPISVRDAATVCIDLPATKCEPRLIINRFDIGILKSGAYKNIDEIIDGSGIRLLGIVPSSTELALFSVKHNLKKNGRAVKSLLRIAKRLCGENTKLPKPKKI